MDINLIKNEIDSLENEINLNDNSPLNDIFEDELINLKGELLGSLRGKVPENSTEDLFELLTLERDSEQWMI